MNNYFITFLFGESHIPRTERVNKTNEVTMDNKLKCYRETDEVSYDPCEGCLCTEDCSKHTPCNTCPSRHSCACATLCPQAKKPTDDGQPMAT